MALGLVGATGWTAVPGMLVAAWAMALLGAGSAVGTLALARRTDGWLESGKGLELLEEETPDLST